MTIFHVQQPKSKLPTVEPQFNEPSLYNEVLDITNDFLHTKNNSKYLKKNLNIMKPLYSHQIIFSVSWLPRPFIESRFHYTCRRILRACMGGKFLKFELLKFKIRLLLFWRYQTYFQNSDVHYITMSYIKTKQEVQIDVTYMYNVSLNKATRK